MRPYWTPTVWPYIVQTRGRAQWGLGAVAPSGTMGIVIAVGFVGIAGLLLSQVWSRG